MVAQAPFTNATTGWVFSDTDPVSICRVLRKRCNRFLSTPFKQVCFIILIRITKHTCLILGTWNSSRPKCPISSVKVVYIYHFHWRGRTLGKQYKLLSECLDCRTQLSFIKGQLCANASARGKRVKSLPSGTICSSCGTQDLVFRNWNTEYPREAI